jgi:hypothetical protein
MPVARATQQARRASENYMALSQLSHESKKLIGLSADQQVGTANCAGVLRCQHNVLWQCGQETAPGSLSNNLTCTTVLTSSFIFFLSLYMMYVRVHPAF